ncbi:L-serine dehydratase [Paenibacillus pini JCM 16418]|uniref:L-serine ammonia-lyase n=1 Tax=Paenibacillus pini JCM 16418 TaxID=1236976 RepID=W7YQJ5_9BACL|nr:L-serine dehydratase [Paenibacillus pini JCM 16418]
MQGGTPQQAVHAVGLALKNCLGLICDPVAGLVEIPCIVRNGLGAVTALASADMALAGVGSVIPADEVIGVMLDVGSSMPSEHRETGLGGLAQTPTGRKLTEGLQEQRRGKSAKPLAEEE